LFVEFGGIRGGSERRIVDSTILPGATVLMDCAISPDGNDWRIGRGVKAEWYGIWLSPLTATRKWTKS
jgi:hypothetical protein